MDEWFMFGVAAVVGGCIRWSKAEDRIGAVALAVAWAIGATVMVALQARFTCRGFQSEHLMAWFEDRGKEFVTWRAGFIGLVVGWVTVALLHHPDGPGPK